MVYLEFVAVHWCFFLNILSFLSCSAALMDNVELLLTAGLFWEKLNPQLARLMETPSPPWGLTDQFGGEVFPKNGINSPKFALTQL